jgi:hypothetical protein
VRGPLDEHGEQPAEDDGHGDDEHQPRPAVDPEARLEAPRHEVADLLVDQVDPEGEPGEPRDDARHRAEAQHPAVPAAGGRGDARDGHAEHQDRG